MPTKFEFEFIFEKRYPQPIPQDRTPKWVQKTI